MLSLPTIFATSFVVALSGALMPGPLLTITISESPRRGLITGPLLILGHGMLEFTLVAALILGLAPLLQKPAVFIITAISGAAVLVWMAWGMLRTLPSLHLQTSAGTPAGHNLVLAGVVLSVANPYWSIWWITIGLGYITQCMAHGIWGIAAFFSGHILADLIWYAAVSTAVWKGRSFLSVRAYRRVTAVCALFLIVFAGMFAVSGLHTLLT